MRMISSAIAFIAIGLVLPRSVGSQQTLLNVFVGTDHQPKQERFETPALRSFGRLWVPYLKDTNCTAVLVTPDIIVTASHCVQDENGEFLSIHYQFVTGAASAEQGVKVEILASKTIPMTRHYRAHEGLDVAFLRLKKALDPTVFPPVEISTLQAESKPGDHFHFQLTGYFKRSAQSDDPPTTESCEPIHYFTDTKELSYDCSTTGDMSGSPIYIWKSGKLTLLALHWGSHIVARDSEVVIFNREAANRGVGGEVIASGLKRFQSYDLLPDKD